MGNCCDGGKRVEISGKEGSTPQAVGYTTHQSEPLTQGQTTSTLRMTTKTTTAGVSANGGRVDTGTTLQGHGGDYGLEPPLRYPMDASGVHYQPVGGPSLALGLFDDKDGSDKDPQESRPASSTAATGGAVTAEAATAAVAEAIAAAGVAETIPLNLPVSSVQSFITTSATHIASTSTQGATTTVVDTAKPTFPLRQRSNYQPSDVMISYSRSDGEIMQQIKDELEARSITVWVDESSIDAGADFLSKIGEAIIDAKFFICILSDRAVRSKYCRDEVALAYVSNTAIFPVNLQPRDQLLPMMDTGLKLQLSNYNWTSLTDSSTRLDSIRTLVSTMKAELDDLSHPHTESGDLPPSFPAFPDGMSPPPVSSPEGSDKAVTSPGEVTVTLERERSVPNGGGGVQSPVSEGEGPDFNKRMRELRERNRAVMALHGDDVSRIMPEQFWTDQFGVVDHVTWERFTGAFLEVFKNPVQDTFTSEDQQQLLDILHRELEVDDDQRIFKYQLMAFCSIHGDASPVWGRVHEQARESFAMREVFNMDSSVRVEAIENLGKFRSAVVIDALRDLLSDPDANVRAVATVSLSRTNANDPVTIRHIMRTLSDKDRLVREAGCLALGHLKARQAISKLSHLWRNDVISHVREAAAVALRQIGGQEVEDVMRVTKVLAEEIRSLTEEKPQ